jgi:hypothetical protein
VWERAANAYIRYYPSIFLEELRKLKNLNQGSRSLSDSGVPRNFFGGEGLNKFS